MDMTILDICEVQMKTFHGILMTIFFACLLIGSLSDNVDIKQMIYFAAMFLHEVIYIYTTKGGNDDE